LQFSVFQLAGVGGRKPDVHSVVAQNVVVCARASELLLVVRKQRQLLFQQRPVILVHQLDLLLLNHALHVVQDVLVLKCVLDILLVLLSEVLS
jgi:hypothetical protein